MKAQLIVHYVTKQILSCCYAAGSVHDFKLFKLNQKKQKYKSLILADKGYQGLEGLGIKCLIPYKASKKYPLTAQQKQINREIGRRRIGIEHVNCRLKVFKILSDRYRNRLKRLGLRMNLIAAIYNLELVKI